MPWCGTGLTCAVESLVASFTILAYYSSVESDSIEIKSNHCWCYRIRHEVSRLTAIWVDLRFDFGSLPLRCRSISYGCGCKNIITSSILPIPSFLSAWFIRAHCFDVLSSRHSTGPDQTKFRLCDINWRLNRSDSSGFSMDNFPISCIVYGQQFLCIMWVFPRFPTF